MNSISHRETIGGFHRPSPWYDVGWPILVGAAVAVGLLHAVRAVGAVNVTTVVIVVALCIGMFAWLTAEDPQVTLFRYTIILPLQGGIAVLTVWSLFDLLGWWATPVVVVAAAGSPVVPRYRYRVQHKVSTVLRKRSLR